MPPSNSRLKERPGSPLAVPSLLRLPWPCLPWLHATLAHAARRSLACTLLRVTGETAFHLRDGDTEDQRQAGQALRPRLVRAQLPVTDGEPTHIESSCPRLHR